MTRFLRHMPRPSITFRSAKQAHGQAWLWQAGALKALMVFAGTAILRGFVQSRERAALKNAPTAVGPAIEPPQTR